MVVQSNIINDRLINKPLTVLVAIKLGQSSLDCRRFGICKMQIITEAELGQLHFDCLAYLKKISFELVELQFLLEWMTDRTYKHYFSTGSFSVEEAYALPGAILKALAWGQTEMYIPEGSYPMEEGVLQVPLLRRLRAS